MSSDRETQTPSTMYDISLANENGEESESQPAVAKTNSLKRFFDATLIKANIKKGGKKNQAAEDRDAEEEDGEESADEQGGSAVKPKPSGKVAKEKRSRFMFGKSSTELKERSHETDASVEPAPSGRNLKRSFSTYFSNVFKRKSKTNNARPNSPDGIQVDGAGRSRSAEEVHHLQAVDDEDKDSSDSNEEDSVESEETNPGSEIMVEITNNLVMKSYGSSATMDIAVESEEAASYVVRIPKKSLQTGQTDEMIENEGADSQEMVQAHKHHH